MITCRYSFEGMYLTPVTPTFSTLQSCRDHAEDNFTLINLIVLHLATYIYSINGIYTNQINYLYYLHNPKSLARRFKNSGWTRQASSQICLCCLAELARHQKLIWDQVSTPLPHLIQVIHEHLTHLVDGDGGIYGAV